MAALNIGGLYPGYCPWLFESMLKGTVGTTIHAWGAVTPGVFDVEKQISYIKTCRPAHRRWKTVKVLVIDEGALRP